MFRRTASYMRDGNDFLNKVILYKVIFSEHPLALFFQKRIISQAVYRIVEVDGGVVRSARNEVEGSVVWRATN